MKLIPLLEHAAERLRAGREAARVKGLDAPLTVSGGRLVRTAGTVHLYEFDVPEDSTLAEDIPISILPPGTPEPTEGYVLGCQGGALLVQTFDAIGHAVGSCTIVPDAAGFYETAGRRLEGMAKHPEQYSLGPAERLIPWLEPDHSSEGRSARGSVSSSVLTTAWGEDLATRRATLASLAIELVRANKRLLLISPDHTSSDDVVGVIAKAMRKAGLQVKSLVSRYELPLRAASAGMALAELGFEAQMNHFYARSRNDKAALRGKYERFRELTPLLAYKADKQRDLDEVKLLEWRLLTQLSDLQRNIKEVDQTLAEYERLSLWKRLGMQAAGKNVSSLGDYRAMYEEQTRTALKELDVAKARIEVLRPEAAVPKELRPEFAELKEEIIRLGGTKQIRELLAAEEGTNRQAFIQNKRLVATTAARVASDALFDRVRFDVLLADEAPDIPVPFLLAAAGLVRERIVLSGDQQDVSVWTQGGSLQNVAP